MKRPLVINSLGKCCKYRIHLSISKIIDNIRRQMMRKTGLILHILDSMPSDI
jgi:hypothetical protein